MCARFERTIRVDFQANAHGSTTQRAIGATNTLVGSAVKTRAWENTEGFRLQPEA
jgi:hypothetical protein